MAHKVAQNLINQKCELLKLQNEAITINKVRRLLGGGASIIDLVDKITLYKEDRSKAIEIAKVHKQENNATESKDSLLKLIEISLKEFLVDKRALVIFLRNKLAKYIDQEIALKTKKNKEKQIQLSNKNDSLEITNLILNRRCNELLVKCNVLKEENYGLKQNYNSQAVKYLEKNNCKKSLLAWEDFKSLKEQFASLGSHSKVAAYDKRGYVVIKFPATDFLTQECRSRSSVYLKAKVSYEYDTQAWVLSEFSDIFKTLDFLKRNKFIFSKELETIEYSKKQNPL